MSFFPKDAEYVAMADAYGPECAACEGDDDASHVDGCRWIAAQDATPAPLDPSKVKAGDTVTLTRGKAVHTDEVSQVSYGHSTHLDTVDGRGTYIVDPDNAYGWTLTAHQPAPEPESMGHVASATVRGVPGQKVFRTGNIGPSDAWIMMDKREGLFWYDAKDVTDVRPLVVIDPADVDRAAIRNALMAEPGAAQGTAHALQVMRIIFTELGIEAAS